MIFQKHSTNNFQGKAAKAQEYFGTNKKKKNRKKDLENIINKNGN